MSILSGFKSVKRYLKTNSGYIKLSQWTSSNTLEFNDGKTAEEKLGSINGITDSLTEDKSDIALSSKAGRNLRIQIDDLTNNINNQQLNVTGAASTIIDNDLSKNRIMVTNANGKVSVSSVDSSELSYITGATGNFQTQITGLSKKIETLSGLVNNINMSVYEGNKTTMTSLLSNLTAPRLCMLTTEDISDKPTNKYGVIIIFKTTANRAGAICICTDGTLLTNAWNTSTESITGWK